MLPYIYIAPLPRDPTQEHSDVILPTFKQLSLGILAPSDRPGNVVSLQVTRWFLLGIHSHSPLSMWKVTYIFPLEVLLERPFKVPLKPRMYLV